MANNESKSLAKVVKLYGIEIRKMPCGKYFEALQTLKSLPADFVKEVSEGNEEFKLSEMITMENLTVLVTKLMLIAPKFLFSFLSNILDVDENVLKDELSPNELLEVCIKFWEVNELENFFSQMKSIAKKSTTLIGFKEQLPSALKSE